MEFWYIWGEISKVMAVLCLVTALAAAAAAVILIMREELTGRLRGELRTGGGKRKGILAALAVGIWIMVIGLSVSAAEISGEGSTEAAADGSTSGESRETADPEEPPEPQDERAPSVTIQMTEETNKDSEGNICCRSDNSGFKVRFEDREENDSGIAHCRVLVSDRGGMKIDREWECAGEDSDEAEFSSAEISGLDDGPIEVTAETTDAAGHRAENSLYFILDTKEPVLTRVLTYRENGGKEIPAGDEPLYDGTDLYYRDEKLITRFMIEDEASVSWKISCSRQPGSANSDSGELINGERSGEGSEGRYEICDEGIYGDWLISGEDSAGNTLAIADDFVCSRDMDGSEETARGISFPFRKILDRTPPEGEIRYTGGGTGYSYDSKRGLEVYFASDVEVSLHVTDRCAGIKMPVDAEDYALITAEGEKGTDFEVTVDGRMQFDAYGRDRAGNSLAVREVFTSEVSAVEGAAPSGERRTQQPDEESCTFCTTIIRDTVSPEVTADISRPVGDQAASDRENAIVYYGNSASLYSGGIPMITTCFTVSDLNADEGRIEVYCAYAAVPEGACCEQVFLSREGSLREECEVIRLSESSGAESTGTGPGVLQLRIRRFPGKESTPDGVYRFGIAGTDKAGNPLVQRASANELCGILCESAEEGAFMTGRKVVDTKAPSGEVLIRNADGNVYCRITAHDRKWVTGQEEFMPYRREKEAFITFSAQDSSPVGVRARILSTSGGNNDTSPDGTKYRSGCGEEIRIRKAQVFRLENVVLRDRAGNESPQLPGTVNFYLDTDLPEVDIDAPSATVRAVTGITLRAADGRPLYAAPVRLAVTAQDGSRKDGNSGLRQVWYDVTVEGKTVREGVSMFQAEDPVTDPAKEEEPLLRYSGEIEIPAGGLWESNDIEVRVFARDNAGNLSDPARGGTFRFGIDTTTPEVTVRYDNNEVRNGRYFAAGRKAEVTVRERNPGSSSLWVRAPGAVTGEWEHRNAASGGEDEWVMEVLFESDGEYTLDIGGTDALGNPAAVQYLGESPLAFTVDRTPPLIEVLWDNTDVRNGEYYNRSRKATVRIKDLSFDERGVRILPASRSFRKVSELQDGRNAVTVPVYEAELPFTEEGSWALSCVCTDLAGNTSVPVSEDPFVIDLTAPRVYFDRDTVREMGAYGDHITPVLCCEDENLPARTCFAVWNNLTAGGTAMACRCAGEGSTKTVTELPDPAGIREADGICVLSGTACDLAGNRTYIRRNICVNRFGSVYDISLDEATAEMLSARYTDAREPLVVAEYNVSPLVSRQITIYRNGAAGILEEGTDYTVTEEKNCSGFKYVYRIDPAVYSEEGKYSILLESEDEAGGRSSSPGRFGTGQDFSPEWAVDRTPPTVRITGVDPDRHRFMADTVPLRLLPSDNMELSELDIRIRDDRGEIISGQVLKGDELQRVLAQNSGEVPVSIAASGRWQTLEAAVVDGAGNKSAEFEGADGADRKGFRVLVSASPIVHLYRSGILPAAAFLALIAAIRFAYGVYKRTLA